jgi:hypothetical protein
MTDKRVQANDGGFTLEGLTRTSAHRYAVGVGGGVEPNASTISVVGGNGSGQFEWDALYSLNDGLSIDDIPENVGLSWDPDDHPEQIHATEDGVWSFRLSLVLRQDESAVGAVLVHNNTEYEGLHGGPVSAAAANSDFRQFTTSGLMAMPSGAYYFSSIVVGGATADPYAPVEYANLVVVRVL